MQGFTRLDGAGPTYHHTPGKIGSYKRLDQGEQIGSWKDSDPRENFVSYSNANVIINSDPSKDMSYFHKFERGTEVTLTREWANRDNSYQELEVRRSELGTVSATLTERKDDHYEVFRADAATAKALLQQLKGEFDSSWNVAR